MRNRYLIVVDMQKDFVDGALGTPEAQRIVGAVKEKIDVFDGHVIFTKDTHFENYMETQEGKNLPVPHCIKGTSGWELTEQLVGIPEQIHAKIYEKNTFGSEQLAMDLKEINESQPIDSIELIGLCTDICVISNALLLKAVLPEVDIMVTPSCCAGVTPEKHNAALETMKSCQIQM